MRALSGPLNRPNHRPHRSRAESVCAYSQTYKCRTQTANRPSSATFYAHANQSIARNQSASTGAMVQAEKFEAFSMKTEKAKPRLLAYFLVGATRRYAPHPVVSRAGRSVPRSPVARARHRLVAAVSVQWHSSAHVKTDGQAPLRSAPPRVLALGDRVAPGVRRGASSEHPIKDLVASLS